jgi:hypothetical protein
VCRPLVFAALLGLLSLILGCGVAPEAAFEFHRDRPPPNTAGSAPYITLMFVAPVQTDVEATINLVSDATGSRESKVIIFHWSASGGDIAAPEAHETVYTCRVKGTHKMTLTITDAMDRHDSLTTTVRCM